MSHITKDIFEITAQNSHTLRWPRNNRHIVAGGHSAIENASGRKVSGHIQCVFVAEHAVCGGIQIA